MTHKDTENKTKKVNTMELNKLSTSLISILITLACCLATFSYKIGQYNNDNKNTKELITKAETDLKEDIKRVEETKAEKDVVALILKKIDDIHKTNENDHRAMFDRLDRLIENKPKE